MSFFVGPLIPLFWTSGDACSEFQSQGGVTCILSCLRTIPQIHLLCDLLTTGMAACHIPYTLSSAEVGSRGLNG